MRRRAWLAISAAAVLGVALYGQTRHGASEPGDAARRFNVVEAGIPAMQSALEKNASPREN